MLAPGSGKLPEPGVLHVGHLASFIER